MRLIRDVSFSRSHNNNRCDDFHPEPLPPAAFVMSVRTVGSARSGHGVLVHKAHLKRFTGDIDR